MADTSNLQNFLTDVATAIKRKKGSQTSIPAANFDTEISNISTVNNQEKTVSPNTSGFNVEPDNGYTGLSKVVVNPVTATIDNNIQSENIKKDITILGITGTLESENSGAKLFATEEAMQNDTTAKNGDLAVVYNQLFKPVVKDCIFSKIKLAGNNITLDEEIPENTWYNCSFRATESGSWYTLYGSLSRTDFSLSAWGETQIEVTYTSEDGIHYTRTDGGDEIIELETEVQDDTYDWDDVFGKFILFYTELFEGLYEYNTDKNENFIKGFSNFQWDETPENVTADEVNVYFASIFSLVQKIVNEATSATYLNGLVVIDNNNIHIYTYDYNGSSGEDYGADCNVAIDTNYLYVLDGSYDGSGAQTIKRISLDLANQTYTVSTVSQIDSIYNRGYVATHNLNCKAFNVSVHVSDSTSIYVEYKNLFVFNSASNGNNFKSAIGYYTKYYLRPAQCDATANYVYGKTFYGKNGVETGTLVSTVSANFNDISAEMYNEIQSKYDEITPLKLTDNNKTVNNDILFVATKSDGTPLIDTSELTDASQLFQNCNKLKFVTALDTSNVTSIHYMFYNCISLETIGKIDVSHARLLNGMFGGCTMLKKLPTLDLSTATSLWNTFYGCINLETISFINTSNIIMLQDAFSSCINLSNESLNNILNMCVNSSVTSNKTLQYIGLTSEQATVCQSLSNWTAFVNAGWTTGY